MNNWFLRGDAQEWMRLKRSVLRTSVRSNGSSSADVDEGGGHGWTVEGHHQGGGDGRCDGEYDAETQATLDDEPPWMNE
jgi:hypothetical protein